ncbi:MAG TPA: protein-disulfide reductase DsbD domain-containing protein, partial [Bacteroidia bacterium]|nr:protein-disulfide reductase DsbD domain-containing protein [Bacteroidia bacterium]
MKLKRSLFYICLSLLISVLSTEKSFSQIYNPVKWEFSVKKISDTQADLIIKANIGKGWHLYSQFMSGKDGPIPTTFTYNPSDDYMLDGKTKESKVISKYEPVYGMNLNYFENSATFTQKIKIKTDKNFSVKGKLNFMVCNDSMCLPPKDADFSFDISAPKTKTSDANPKQPAINNSSDTAKIKSATTVVTASSDTIKKNNSVNSDSVSTTTNTNNSSFTNASTAQAPGLSGWLIFILGFFGGLAALITPCV